MTRPRILDSIGQELGSVADVERLILLVRGHRVMLDADLARIYGVTTARLNQQVKRNGERFPPDFMFQLTPAEWQALMLQSATSTGRHGGRRKLPFAFSEHGAVMLASVLNTRIAVQASVGVVRAFVRLREVLAARAEHAGQLVVMEQKLAGHDAAIRSLFDAIRQLMTPRAVKRRRIGFLVKDAAARYPAARGKRQRVGA